MTRALHTAVEKQKYTQISTISVLRNGTIIESLWIRSNSRHYRHCYRKSYWTNANGQQTWCNNATTILNSSTYTLNFQWSFTLHQFLDFDFATIAVLDWSRCSTWVMIVYIMAFRGAFCRNIYHCCNLLMYAVLLLGSLAISSHSVCGTSVWNSQATKGTSSDVW